MSVIFSDNFNTGTEPNTTNWLERSGDDLDLVGSKVRGISKGAGLSFALMTTTTAAHAAIADCKVTLTQASASGDGAPAARVTDADTAPTMYACNIFANTLETLRYNNSNSPTVLQSSGVTSVANGVVALEVTGTGATVTLKAYYQGSQVGANISDTSASRIVSAGQTGVIVYDLTSTVADYDDFSVDDLAAGGFDPATIIPSAAQMHGGGFVGRMNA